MLYLGGFADRSRQGATGDSPPDWPARFTSLAAQARDPRLRAFYTASPPAGDTPLAAVPLLALDVETTGLDARRDEIVSIGLVPLDLDRVRASASRHWIVRPRRALAAESVTLHGITHSQVAAAPDLADILDELLAALAGQILVVHCREIERAFLAAALRERIGEGLEFPVIDTMDLEARLHRGKKPGLLDRLRRRPPVSIRLAVARARYGLPRYRPHHALTDALATAELLLAQVAHRFTPETPLRELWR